ncbi:MAG: hypothetical protein HRT70_10600 [Flavobacteriaceae bacterium]|nr:hypothetical protein [Flavobacteriaceae bacterium]
MKSDESVFEEEELLFEHQRIVVDPGQQSERIDKFLIDAFVNVHTVNWSSTSTLDTTLQDAQVTNVDTGTNTITVNRSLGFTPDSTYVVDLIGFKDGGLPYRIL